MTRGKQPVWTFSAALAHLQESQTTLSPGALGALSGASKKDLIAFARSWIDLPAERRRRAAQLMVELAEQNIELDFNVLYRHLLTDEDPQVRARGIEGLWEDEDPALVKPLVAFLRSDPAAVVRAAAADALGRFVLLAEYGRLHKIDVALIGEALLATIRSALEDLMVRCRAVEALAYWSQAIVRDVIVTAYADEAPEMRASAVAAMGRTADHYWSKLSASELDSLDARMRFEAARTAGELENRSVAPRLVALLDDLDREVQGAAITALGQIGGKLAKQALTQAAESDDEVLSALADEALQELEFANNSELLLFDMEGEDDVEIDAGEEVWGEDEIEEEIEEEN
jgi:HEAT repeat protein